MKKIYIYVLTLFLKYLIVVQLGILVLSLISSTLGESKLLSDYDYSLFQFLKLQLCWVVINNNLTMPLTTTLAAIITILILMRSRELLAYVTIGGRIVGLAIPLISVGVIVMGYMVFIEYYGVPKAREIRSGIIDDIKGTPMSARGIGYTDIWILDGKNKIVNIALSDFIENELKGVREYFIDDNSNITKYTEIETVRKNSEDDWLLSGIRVVDLSSNPPSIRYEKDEIVKSKFYDDLISLSVNNSPRALSPSDLVKLIDVMKSRGLNVNSYLMILYSKIANILSVIILLILVFPMMIDFSRNYSVIKNVGFAFLLGMIYWIIQSFLYSLGTTGRLSPIVANFSPILIFLIVSILLPVVRKVKLN